MLLRCRLCAACWGGSPFGAGSDVIHLSAAPALLAPLAACCVAGERTMRMRISCLPTRRPKALAKTPPMLFGVVGVAGWAASSVSCVSSRASLARCTQHLLRELAAESSFAPSKITKNVMDMDLFSDPRPGKDLYDLFIVGLEVDPEVDRARGPPSSCLRLLPLSLQPPPTTSTIMADEDKPREE